MNIEIRWTAVYCDCLINWQKQLGCISLSRYVAFESFNLKLWFENNLHRLRMEFLSIGFCKQTNKQRMKGSKEWRKGSKRIGMIKMVNCKYKLTVVHFARPDPMQICACAWIYHPASGLRGLRAVAGCEPLGRWATGPPWMRTLQTRLQACLIFYQRVSLYIFWWSV